MNKCVYKDWRSGFFYFFSILSITHLIKHRIKSPFEA